MCTVVAEATAVFGLCSKTYINHCQHKALTVIALLMLLQEAGVLLQLASCATAPRRGLTCITVAAPPEQNCIEERCDVHD